jgi:predicted dinucleotide-binding enzyme
MQKELEGKIIIDITNILYLYDDKAWGQVSSVEQNKWYCLRTDKFREALEVAARWLCAYKSTFSTTLDDLKNTNPRETQVCGDDAEAKQLVIAMINETGFKALDCGGLKNARIVELLGPPFIMTVDNLNGAPKGCWRYS